MIHPTAIVETKLIGDCASVGAYSYISPRVKIGNNCKIFNSVSIGSPPQWVGNKTDGGCNIVIGDNTEIREFVTINIPTSTVDTFIGCNCLLMANSHIGHDVQVHDSVVIGVGVAIAGFVVIGYGSYLGLNSSIHQHSVVPPYSMLGSNSFFKYGSHIPGLIWVGCPAKPVKVNYIGIERNVSDKDLGKEVIENAEEFLRHSNIGS
jgi:UDP-N-acetylglucosamine acyltransferase